MQRGGRVARWRFYYCICVLILRYMCVLILLYMQRRGRVIRWRHYYTCVLILLCIYVRILLHMCPHTAMYIFLHTTTYVSSYCYICVSAGALLRLGKTIKRQKAHPRGVCSTTALVSALLLILEKKNGSKCSEHAIFFFVMLTYADVC